MADREPRAVVVTRPTDYEALLARHATRDQARFFLESRGQSLADVEERHRRAEAALARVAGAIPTSWRRSRVGRADLATFLFEPDDLVVAVGQDGLVANVAKYLHGQAVVGVNPDPERVEGVLVRHRPEAVVAVLRAAAAHRAALERRTMVEARLDDGQRLLALNELFVGHRSHQSARYRIRLGEREERQSSSGLIVATGTGATGWARSVALRRVTPVTLPKPEELRLVVFVREAWASVATGTTLTDAELAAGSRLEVVSEMNEGGALFGDGIEEDRLELGWGVRARIAVAEEQLALVV